MPRHLTRQQQAAATIRRVIELVDADDLVSPRWYVERLRGAIAALDHRRPGPK
jgi:hypothetical protein